MIFSNGIKILNRFLVFLLLTFAKSCTHTHKRTHTGMHTHMQIHTQKKKEKKKDSMFNKTGNT